MEKQTAGNERTAFSNGRPQKSRRYKTHIQYLCGVIVPSAILLMLFTFSSIYSIPLQTVKAYCEAYQTQDWSGVYSCLSSGVEDTLRNGMEGRAAFVKAMEQRENLPKTTSFQIERYTEETDPFTRQPARAYTVSYTQAGSSKQHTKTITVSRQENGSWLVTTEPFIEHPLKGQRQT